MFAAQLVRELDKMEDNNWLFDSIIFVNADTLWVSGPYFTKASALRYVESLSDNVTLVPQAWLSRP